MSLATAQGACRTLTHCRMCDSGNLEKFLDLGMQPPADAFLHPSEYLAPQVYYPLEMLLCMECGLAQLSVVVSPELLYSQEYPYEASVTGAGRAHFEHMAQELVHRFVPQSVLDIGSNDGVTLEGFRLAGIDAIGVEPVRPLVEAARARGLNTIGDYWNERSAWLVGTADLITATNVFAHVDDLHEFMHAVDIVLSPRGVLVIEVPYFLELVAGLEYDTIYHEHLSYITLGPLNAFLALCDYRLFDVQPVGIHGGSLRLFIDRGVRPVGIDPIRFEKEAATGIGQIRYLQEFARRVRAHRDELRHDLGALKILGKRIAGVSAPAKGSTLINYCGLGEYLEFLTEKSERKLYRVSPGARLAVLPDSALLGHKIDYGLILAWNFAEAIAWNQTSFVEQGGVLLRPIPRLEEVTL